MSKSFRRGEIWMVDFPKGNDYIIKGYRPAIVVSTDIVNTNVGCKTATVIPLTSSPSKGDLLSHIKIKANSGVNKLKGDSTALCEQLTTVNKDVIRFCLGRVDDRELEEVNSSMLNFLGLI